MLRTLDEGLEPIRAHATLVKTELERLSGRLDGLQMGLKEVIRETRAGQAIIRSEFGRVVRQLDEEILSRTESERQKALSQGRLRIAVYLLAGLVLLCACWLSILISKISPTGH